MKIETYKCDGCGKQKTEGETNWKIVSLPDDGTIVISPFEDNERNSNDTDFCGVPCVLGKVSSCLS